MNSANNTLVEDFCASCRTDVLSEITSIVERHGWNHPELNVLILDYPLRPAKGLRPAICIAVARSLGVTDQGILPTAAVIELLHNAFLIHDDVEDQSMYRRGERTLQYARGAPIAINVADAMFALSIAALLDNTDLLGLRLALEVLSAVSRMFHFTVEGQAIELSWIRDNVCHFSDAGYRASYEDMVVRKTAMYSFVTPVDIGSIVAAATARFRDSMARYARHLGVAFQIADDILNLRGDVSAYGKETLGDLWEGKRTLMLLHALHCEHDGPTLERARAILARGRPPPMERGNVAMLRDESRRDYKTAEDVHFLTTLVHTRGGIEYATNVALGHVAQATEAFDNCSSELAVGPGRDFLAALPRYVLDRLR